MRRATLSQRLRYRFDNSLAKGLGPMIGLLALVTVAVVVVAGIVLWLGDVDLDDDGNKGIEGIWASLMRTLDAGTMGSDRGWPFRLTSLAVTVAGIFIVSTLIGILANGLGQRIEELRRGRSNVIENGHTLLLGWSPKVFLIIREIAESAGPEEHPCVVVLAERDMVEMEEHFRQAFRGSNQVRLVSRTGIPSSIHDLERVAPHQARSVVVLRDEEKGDAAAVRTILALEHLGIGRSMPVVVELAESQRADALAAASTLNVIPVVSSDWIATVTARAVYAPFLTDIYEDLLNFDGAEVQFTEIPPALIDRHFHEVCATVVGGAPFGVRTGGHLSIAPPANRQLAAGDELVVITDSRTNLRFRENPATVTVASDAISDIALTDPKPAHLLVLGWSDLGVRVLDLLDKSLPPGSLIDIVAHGDLAEILPTESFQRFTLRHTTGSATDPRTLVKALANGDVSRVLVLSNRRSDDPAHHDADAMLTVLELRHLLDRDAEIQVTVEITDPDNVELIRRGAREEFIVGERLVSLLMSQVSQTAGVVEVLRSLLVEDETDLTLIPAETVLGGASEINGSDAAATLRRHGHYLIGAGQTTSLQLRPNLSALVVSKGMTLVTVSAAASQPNAE